MSDSDEVMSLTESVSDGNLSESSNSDEMDVVGIVRPYADEPLAMKKKKMRKIKVVLPLSFCAHDTKAMFQ